MPIKLVVVVMWFGWMKIMLHREDGRQNRVAKAPFVCVVNIDDCPFVSEKFGKFCLEPTTTQWIVFGEIEMSHFDFQ